MPQPTDWTDLARQGRTVEAILACRATSGAGLGEAKATVERWLEIHLPPSVSYRRAVTVGRRVDERVAEYAERTGQVLAWTVHVLAASELEFTGQPSLLAATLPVDHERLDLAVEIELPGFPRRERRPTVLEHLRNGVRMVWAIDVEDTTIRVATEASRWYVWFEDGILDGGDVLPGFSCKVSDLFG